jgi:hypothetical protein
METIAALNIEVKSKVGVGHGQCLTEATSLEQTSAARDQFPISRLPEEVPLTFKLPRYGVLGSVGGGFGRMGAIGSYFPVGRGRIVSFVSLQLLAA